LAVFIAANEKENHTMDKRSAVARAQEHEEYQERTWKALDAWEAAGHEGSMSTDWMELWECTQLTAHDLLRAKKEKVRRLRIAKDQTKKRLAQVSGELFALEWELAGD
jgi:hypothetical protein